MTQKTDGYIIIKWLRLSGITVQVFLCIFLLLLPSINDYSFADTAVTSKTFFFLTTLVILLGAVLVILVNVNQFKLKLSKIDITIFMYVMYIVCSRYLITSYPGFSIKFIELLGLTLFYIILRFIFPTNFLFLFTAILLSGIIQVIYGFTQVLGYLPSYSRFISGSFFNSGPYSGFLSIVGCLSLGMYLFKKELSCRLKYSMYKKGTQILERVLNFLPLLTIVLIIIILPATHSRAAWLSLAIGTSLLFFYRNKWFIHKAILQTNSYLKIITMVITLIVLTTGVYQMYYSDQNSSSGRILIWKVGINMIKENPIFGAGYDKFKTNYMNAQASYFENDVTKKDVLVADNTYYAFNELLQLLIENGLVALIIVCFALFICYSIKVNVEFKILKSISLSVILSIITFGMVSYPTEILPIKVIFICLVALLANLDNKKFTIINLFETSKTRLIITKSFSILISITILSFILFENYILKTAFKNWRQALTAYNYEYYLESISKFEEAYPVLKQNGDFLMNYGKALSVAKKYPKARTILERAKQYLNTTIIEYTLGDVYKELKLYKEAETAYKKAARMVPNRFYPEFLLVKLYVQTHQKDKAYYKAKELLQKDIKIPSRAIEEMREEVTIIIKTHIPIN